MFEGHNCKLLSMEGFVQENEYTTSPSDGLDIEMTETSCNQAEPVAIQSFSNSASNIGDITKLRSNGDKRLHSLLVGLSAVALILLIVLISMTTYMIVQRNENARVTTSNSLANGNNGFDWLLLQQLKDEVFNNTEILKNITVLLQSIERAVIEVTIRTNEHTDIVVNGTNILIQDAISQLSDLQEVTEDITSIVSNTSDNLKQFSNATSSAFDATIDMELRTLEQLTDIMIVSESVMNNTDVLIDTTIKQLPDLLKLSNDISNSVDNVSYHLNLLFSVTSNGFNTSNDMGLEIVYQMIKILSFSEKIDQSINEINQNTVYFTILANNTNSIAHSNTDQLAELIKLTIDIDGKVNDTDDILQVAGLVNIGINTINSFAQNHTKDLSELITITHIIKKIAHDTFYSTTSHGVVSNNTNALARNIVTNLSFLLHIAQEIEHTVNETSDELHQISTYMITGINSSNNLALKNFHQLNQLKLVAGEIDRKVNDTDNLLLASLQIIDGVSSINTLLDTNIDQLSYLLSLVQGIDRKVNETDELLETATLAVVGINDSIALARNNTIQLHQVMKIAQQITNKVNDTSELLQVVNHIEIITENISAVVLSNIKQLTYVQALTQEINEMGNVAAKRLALIYNVTLATNDFVQASINHSLKLLIIAHDINSAVNDTDELLQAVIQTKSIANETKALSLNNNNHLVNLEIVTNNIVESIAFNTAMELAYHSNNTMLLKLVIDSVDKSSEHLTDIIASLTHIMETNTFSANVIGDILSFIRAYLPETCEEIKEKQPNILSGMYSLASTVGNGSIRIYCHMGELCGSEGGWTRLAYLNMSDSTQNCPHGLRLYQSSGGLRACGRPTNSNAGCASVYFSSNGFKYSEVCGRVVGYQYGTPDALNTLYGQNHNNLNAEYLDGVSITRGNPRQHVWSLIAGITDTGCPCSHGNTQQVQSFIGSNYFCESGNPNSVHSHHTFYTSDPLWDGAGCGVNEAACCSVPGIPWFHRDYGNDTTTDYLELRVCGDQSASDEDVPISFYEIFVK